MKSGLHHVELYVSDLAKAREFWTFLLEYLGYKLYQEWDQGFSYLINNTYIVFVQTEKDYLDVAYHRKRTGLNHLAFHGSKETVDELYQILKDKGVSILYEDKHPYAGGKGYYAIFFEDPDRIKVEIVAT